DRDRAALLDLHGGLDGVGIEGVEVFLAAAVQAHRLGVDSLLDGGVRYLLDQDADLQVRASLAGCFRLLTDQSISLSIHVMVCRSACIRHSAGWRSAAPSRMKSTISSVPAPGVKTAATPSCFSSGMSSAGIVPPTVTRTSSTPCSFSSSTT